MRLQSIELELPDPNAAAAFLAGPWGAIDGGGSGTSRYIRGTSTVPYLVAAYEAAAPGVRSVTFAADNDRIGQIGRRARTAGLPVDAVTSLDPGGGAGIEVVLPEGERFRFLSGVAQAERLSGRDAPVKLTHVVFNATDAEASARVAEEVLGFTVSDRTAGMVFVRCNASHHSIAFARAGVSSLNHIAFEMADVDAVMRGIGRMRDIDSLPDWGPGRHGPGANVFAYFIAPFGAVVEFSTAVEIVDDTYHAGTPADWTWPPNRIDQWGISQKAVARLAEAERRFTFTPPERARSVA